jgi:pimeloyl-ACP methyl ester carboxylesterase
MSADMARSVPRIVLPVSGLFVPGWGAHAGIYRGAVPAGWAIPDPPTFVASGATVAAYRRWIVELCRSRRGPFTLAGHSFGAVLAVHAALAGSVEAEIARLVLVSPSALPLEKPVPLMFWDFSRRVAAGWLPPRDAARAARQMVFHPLLARRLGMEVRAIDLSEDLARVRDLGLPCTVIAASTDTLTPPSLCRRVAELCGGEYRELDVPGGHLWFLRARDLLAGELSAATEGADAN